MTRPSLLGATLRLATRTQRVRAFEHRQLTKIHELLGTPAVAVRAAQLEVLTPGASVHGYAMLIDNASGDSIYIPPDLLPMP